MWIKRKKYNELVNAGLMCESWKESYITSQEAGMERLNQVIELTTRLRELSIEVEAKELDFLGNMMRKILRMIGE